MSPELRRERLLDLGVQIFADGDVESMSMTDIATAAGVTRRLLYHYFPTKADYFGAVWQRAHRQLREAISSLAADTVRELVIGALDAYVDFYRANLSLVRVANRSSIAQNPAVRGPVDRDLAALCASFLDLAGATGAPRRRAEVGFAGWIAFVRVGCVATLLDGRLSLRENRDLCVAVLDAAVGAHVDLNRQMP